MPRNKDARDPVDVKYPRFRSIRLNPRAGTVIGTDRGGFSSLFLSVSFSFCRRNVRCVSLTDR